MPVYGNRSRSRKQRTTAAVHRGGRKTSANGKTLTWYECKIEGLCCSKCKKSIELGERHATGSETVLCETCGNKSLWVKIRAQYDSHCRRCYGKIKRGVPVMWHPEKRTIKHIECKRGRKPKGTNRGTRLVAGRETV